MNVAVVGAGTMGSGIAYVSAASGHSVVVVEQDQKLLDSGMKRVEESIQRTAQFRVNCRSLIFGYVAASDGSLDAFFDSLHSRVEKLLVLFDNNDTVTRCS